MAYMPGSNRQGRRQSSGTNSIQGTDSAEEDGDAKSSEDGGSSFSGRNQESDGRNQDSASSMSRSSSGIGTSGHSNSIGSFSDQSNLAESPEFKSILQGGGAAGSGVEELGDSVGKLMAVLNEALGQCVDKSGPKTGDLSSTTTAATWQAASSSQQVLHSQSASTTYPSLSELAPETTLAPAASTGPSVIFEEGEALPRLPSLRTLLRMEDHELDPWLGRTSRPREEDAEEKEEAGHDIREEWKDQEVDELKDQEARPRHSSKSRHKKAPVQNQQRRVSIEGLAVGLGLNSQLQSETEKSWGHLGEKLVYIGSQLDAVIVLSKSRMINQALGISMGRRRSIEGVQAVEEMTEVRSLIEGSLQSINPKLSSKVMKAAIGERLGKQAYAVTEELHNADRDVKMRAMEPFNDHNIDVLLRTFVGQQGYVFDNMAERRHLARHLKKVEFALLQLQETEEKAEPEKRQFGRAASIDDEVDQPQDILDEDGTRRASKRGSAAGTKNNAHADAIAAERSLKMRIRKAMSKVKGEKRVFHDWLDIPWSIMRRLENSSRFLITELDELGEEVSWARKKVLDSNTRWSESRTFREPTLVDLEIQVQDLRLQLAKRVIARSFHSKGNVHAEWRIELAGYRRAQAALQHNFDFALVKWREDGGGNSQVRPSPWKRNMSFTPGAVAEDFQSWRLATSGTSATPQSPEEEKEAARKAKRGKIGNGMSACDFSSEFLVMQEKRMDDAKRTLSNRWEMLRQQHVRYHQVLREQVLHWLKGDFMGATLRKLRDLTGHMSGQLENVRESLEVVCLNCQADLAQPSMQEAGKRRKSAGRQSTAAATSRKSVVRGPSKNSDVRLHEVIEEIQAHAQKELAFIATLVEPAGCVTGLMSAQDKLQGLSQRRPFSMLDLGPKSARKVALFDEGKESQAPGRKAVTKIDVADVEKDENEQTEEQEDGQAVQIGLEYLTKVMEAPTKAAKGMAREVNISWSSYRMKWEQLITKIKAARAAYSTLLEEQTQSRRMRMRAEFDSNPEKQQEVYDRCMASRLKVQQQYEQTYLLPLRLRNDFLQDTCEDIEQQLRALELSSEELEEDLQKAMARLEEQEEKKAKAAAEAQEKLNEEQLQQRNLELQAEMQQKEEELAEVDGNCQQELNNLMTVFGRLKDVSKEAAKEAMQKMPHLKKVFGFEDDGKHDAATPADPQALLKLKEELLHNSPPDEILPPILSYIETQRPDKGAGFETAHRGSLTVGEKVDRLNVNFAKSPNKGQTAAEEGLEEARGDKEEAKAETVHGKADAKDEAARKKKKLKTEPAKDSKGPKSPNKSFKRSNTTRSALQISEENQPQSQEYSNLNALMGAAAETPSRIMAAVKGQLNTASTADAAENPKTPGSAAEKKLKNFKKAANVALFAKAKSQRKVMTPTEEELESENKDEVADLPDPESQKVSADQIIEQKLAEATRSVRDSVLERLTAGLGGDLSEFQNSLVFDEADDRPLSEDEDEEDESEQQARRRSVLTLTREEQIARIKTIRIRLAEDLKELLAEADWKAISEGLKKDHDRLRQFGVFEGESIRLRLLTENARLLVRNQREMAVRLLNIYSRDFPSNMERRIVAKMEADMALADRKAIALEKCMQELIMPCLEHLTPDEKEVAVQELEKQITQAVDVMHAELWDILQKAGGKRKPRQEEHVSAVSVEATFREGSILELKSLQEYVPTEQDVEEAKAKRKLLEEKKEKRRLELLEEKEKRKHVALKEEEQTKKREEINNLLQGVLRESEENPKSEGKKTNVKARPVVEDGPHVMWWMSQDPDVSPEAKPKGDADRQEYVEAMRKAKLQAIESAKLKPLMKAGDRKRGRGQAGQSQKDQLPADFGGLDLLQPVAAGPAASQARDSSATVSAGNSSRIAKETRINEPGPKPQLFGKWQQVGQPLAEGLAGTEMRSPSPEKSTGQVEELPKPRSQAPSPVERALSPERRERRSKSPERISPSPERRSPSPERPPRRGSPIEDMRRKEQQLSEPAQRSIKRVVGAHVVSLVRSSPLPDIAIDEMHATVMKYDRPKNLPEELASVILTESQDVDMEDLLGKDERPSKQARPSPDTSPSASVEPSFSPPLSRLGQGLGRPSPTPEAGLSRVENSTALSTECSREVHLSKEVTVENSFDAQGREGSLQDAYLKSRSFHGTGLPGIEVEPGLEGKLWGKARTEGKCRSLLNGPDLKQQEEAPLTVRSALESPKQQQVVSEPASKQEEFSVASVQLAKSPEFLEKWSRQESAQSAVLTEESVQTAGASPPEMMLPGVVSRQARSGATSVQASSLPPVPGAKAAQAAQTKVASPSRPTAFTLASLAVSPSHSPGKDQSVGLATPGTESDKRGAGTCGSSRGLSSCATTARSPNSTVQDWMRSPTPLTSALAESPKRPHTSFDLRLGLDPKQGPTRPVSVLSGVQTKRRAKEEANGGLPPPHNSATFTGESEDGSEVFDPLQDYEKDWQWSALDAYLESLMVEDLPHESLTIGKLPSSQTRTLAADDSPVTPSALRPPSALELDLYGAQDVPETSSSAGSVPGRATPTASKPPARVTPSRTRGEALCELSVGTTSTPVPQHSQTSAPSRLGNAADAKVPSSPQRPSSRATAASPRRFWTAGNDERLRVTVDGMVRGKVRYSGAGNDRAQSLRSR